MKLFLLRNEYGRISSGMTGREYERLLITIEEMRKLVSGKTVVASAITPHSRDQAMVIRIELGADSIEIWEALGLEDQIGQVPVDIETTVGLCSARERSRVDCLILVTSVDLVKLAGRYGLWQLKSFDAGMTLYIGEGAERSFITSANL